MSKKVLLVIDMLKDFVDPGGALTCGTLAREIVPLVTEKVKEFRERGDTVIFIGDGHEPDDLEFNRFPPHCVKNTEGAKLIEELDALVDSGCITVTKNRYSSFHNTGLDEILSRITPEEVHVTGVCTNICVLYTVEELCNRDYPTVVYKGGVASFDGEAHQWALHQMENVLGAKIV